MKSWTFPIITASLGFVCAALPVLSGPVLAETPDGARIIKNVEYVSYDGLDLATDKGQKLLEQRVEIAARRVCGLNDARTGTRLRPAGTYTCMAKARANARSQVAALIAEIRRGG